MKYFYPRSPCGERHLFHGGYFDGRKFLSTLSLRRATRGGIRNARAYGISIHALLAESDRNRSGRRHGERYISIHALLAESDVFKMSYLEQQTSISIHALLAESDQHYRARDVLQQTISIHALLAESDRRRDGENAVPDISIHALLAESDRFRCLRRSWICYFYPRSPCGERPKTAACCIGLMRFLSTLSLRRATTAFAQVALRLQISIHALLAESDRSFGYELLMLCRISIHALLAESDFFSHAERYSGVHFYPRSPCGERRLFSYLPVCGDMHFYPRSPCGERHHESEKKDMSITISIHALLAESDLRH